MPIRAFVGLGLLALCCACAGAQGSGAASQGFSSAALPRTANIKYLYVAYLNPAHVVRYPIVGGVLSTTPDDDLSVTVPSNSRIAGIALDSYNSLYIAVPFLGGEAGTVAVYADGASGNAMPTRTIAVPFYSSSSFSRKVTGVAVDSRAYVYVGMLQAQYTSQEGLVEIYAPDASGSPSPIQTLRLGLEATAVTVDSAGRLFVGQLGGLMQPPTRFISVFPSPLVSPSQNYPICNEATVTGLAVGTVQGAEWIVASVRPHFSGGGKLFAWKGVGARACPQSAPHTISIAGLNNPTPPRNEAGFSAVALDAADGKLFVAARGAITHAVYEVDPLVFTPQKPIATITSKNIPVALAVSQ